MFRAVWLWAVLAIFLSMLPYLYAWLVTPPGKFFSGILANHNDFSAYIAAMRQGAEGNWLFRITFSTEDWQPRLMLPLYMVVGKLIRPFSQNYVLWFNIMRAGGLLMTLWAFLFWLRQVLPGKPRQQLTGWFLMAFGGGLGWLLWPLTTPLAVSTNYFPDVNMPEWTTMLVSLNPPHYIIGMGLEVILFGCVLKMHRQQSWRWAAIAAIVATALGLIYVYQTAVVGLVIGTYLLAIAWRERRIPWGDWWRGALILLPLLPLLFYYGYWVNQDTTFATYAASEINNIPPPPILGAILGYGLLGILAAIGGRRWLGDGHNWLPLIWIGGNLLVMYMPIVQYSGRFALGLIVPVATLAAYGLEEVFLPWLRETNFYGRFSRLTPTPFASLRRMILLLAMPSALMVALFPLKNVTLQEDFPYYMPVSEREAAVWLAEHTGGDDVVMAYYPVGNYLPSLSSTRVFMGQFFLTLNFDQKADMVEQFWDADTSDEWREAFIEEWQITHIYLGAYERQLMQEEDIVPPGEAVYEQGGVMIYEVIP